jgi:dolichyl-phosphate-mannose-protein mannosyltransferase
MLLFFTFTTTLGLVKFHNQRHQAFGDDWWMWLIFTGWSIGCVCSVKWVGMFAMAMVGVYTVEDLWEKFGDLKMPVVSQLSTCLHLTSC